MALLSLSKTIMVALALLSTVADVHVNAAGTTRGAVRGSRELQKDNDKNKDKDDDKNGGNNGGGGPTDEASCPGCLTSPSGVVEAHNCEPDPARAIAFIDSRGHADKGSMECYADPVNGCGGGCCRMGSAYFICDDDNSKPLLPCVCNADTNPLRPTGNPPTQPAPTAAAPVAAAPIAAAPVASPVVTAPVAVGEPLPPADFSPEAPSPFTEAPIFGGAAPAAPAVAPVVAPVGGAAPVAGAPVVAPIGAIPTAPVASPVVTAPVAVGEPLPPADFSPEAPSPFTEAPIFGGAAPAAAPAASPVAGAPVMNPGSPDVGTMPVAAPIASPIASPVAAAPVAAAPVAAAPVAGAPVAAAPVAAPVAAAPAAPVAGATANVVDTAIAAQSFFTLLDLVEYTGLTDTLANGGPYTVFAPLDSALPAPGQDLEDFKAVTPIEDIEQILLYHVVQDQYTSADIAALPTGTLTTLQGGDLVFDFSNGPMVNNANIIATDIQASNGIIHAIDGLLVPLAK